MPGSAFDSVAWGSGKASLLTATDTDTWTAAENANATTQVQPATDTDTWTHAESAVAVSGAPLFFDNFSTGDFTHATNGCGWDGHNEGGSGIVADVSSADPAGLGLNAARFQFKAGAGGWCQKNFFYPLTNEMFLEWWEWIPATYYHPAGAGGNNKHITFYYSETFYNRANGSTAFDMERNPSGLSDGGSKLLPQSTPHNDGGLVFEGSNTGYTNPLDIGPTASYPSKLGQLNHYQEHWRTTSAAGAGDGLWRYAVNGTLFYEKTNGDFSNKDGSTLGGVYPAQLGAGYIFGATNVGYTVDNTFYVYKFTIYNTNPGWGI